MSIVYLLVNFSSDFPLHHFTMHRWTITVNRCQHLSRRRILLPCNGFPLSSSSSTSPCMYMVNLLGFYQGIVIINNFSLIKQKMHYLIDPPPCYTFILGGDLVSFISNPVLVKSDPNPGLKFVPTSS
jgi:hypothetical protein